MMETVNSSSSLIAASIGQLFFTNSAGISSASIPQQRRKTSFVNQLVYNAFIAPFYTALAAFGSLILLNAILFLTASILIWLFLVFFPQSFSIVFCSLINCFLIEWLMDRKNSGGFLHFHALPLAIGIGSFSLGICSIYWPIRHSIFATTFSVPFGALIGLNIFLIFNRSLMDGLVKEFAGKMVQIEN